MLRAELRHISPNDYDDWAAFAAADHPEPWDEFGWFVLDIGMPTEAGTTLFQVLVATPAAANRAIGADAHRRILIVNSFEPQVLEKALKDHVASVASHTWEGIVEQLRKNMYWEYEQWG